MHNRDIFLIFYNMKIYYVFSLELPHSNEYTQYTIKKSIKKKITLNYPQPAAMGVFPRDLRTSLKQPWLMGHQCSSH